MFLKIFNKLDSIKFQYVFISFSQKNLILMKIFNFFMFFHKFIKKFLKLYIIPKLTLNQCKLININFWKNLTVPFTIFYHKQGLFIIQRSHLQNLHSFLHQNPLQNKILNLKSKNSFKKYNSKETIQNMK